MENLVDKVVVVTGASSGIGRSYARALVEAGARVTMVGRDRARLTAVASSLDPLRTHIVTADVSEVGAADLVVASTLEHFGDLDVMVANAGIYLGGEFAVADPAAIHALVSTNVFGAMASARAALPHLIEKHGGDIFFTSSVSGYQAIHWEPVYSASKHAVHAFSDTLRRQLVGSGVRVGSIAPGVVLNELWGYAEADPGAEEQTAQATGITSEDVAEALLFALSRPRHVTIRDLVILPTAQEI